ncbi:MAG TPA: hypothetical protein VJL84_12425 [Kiloniellales bacterium]|nr:hypothetical protein [Kiloniellales bacterium]
MIRLGTALALVAWVTAWVTGAGMAQADTAAFQALSPDAQLVVNKVTAGKPGDTTVCAEGPDQLRSSLISATKGLYFAGSFKGDPREAGTSAGDYLKALCKH